MTTMTMEQQLVTVALCALATMATRFAPFLLFSSRRPTPGYVRYLGEVLPAAIFGMLVVYSLKDVSLLSGSRGLPEALALGVVVGLHRWKGQMLLSIAGGTACYMLLVQTIF